MDRGGSWWVVVALGLRIVVDPHVDCGGGDQFFFFFCVVIMWWLFLVDVIVVGGF